EPSPALPLRSTPLPVPWSPLPPSFIPAPLLELEHELVDIPQRTATPKMSHLRRFIFPSPARMFSAEWYAILVNGSRPSRWRPRGYIPRMERMVVLLLTSSHVIDAGRVGWAKRKSSSAMPS